MEQILKKELLTISTTKLFLAEILLGDYYFHRWTSKPTEIYETKNNVWKRCKISIQNSIDNRIEITKIKLDSASLNNGQKCRKPVFMRTSGICFIKWLWFGSICGRDKGRESTDGEIKA